MIGLPRQYIPSRYGRKSSDKYPCLDSQSNLSFGQDMQSFLPGQDRINVEKSQG